VGRNGLAVLFRFVGEPEKGRSQNSPTKDLTPLLVDPFAGRRYMDPPFWEHRESLQRSPVLFVLNN